MTEQPAERVAAVVLAAGESRRLGEPKLLLAFCGSTVIGSVVRAMEGAGVDPIVVVAGTMAPEVAAVLRATRAQVVQNPDPSRGMVSSLRVGLGALPPSIGRILVALGDQPRLEPATITHLLAEQRRLGVGIAIASYAGKRGHPVAFAERYREEMLRLPDDRSLRDLIHSHGEDVAVVECGSESVIRDIDTRENYERELRRGE